MRPWLSNANPVGRYRSANLISENPGGTSAPSSSTVEGGTVPASVTVSVARTIGVRCGEAVSVETKDVVTGDAEGGSTVLVPGRQAASIITINTETLSNLPMTSLS